MSDVNDFNLSFFYEAVSKLETPEECEKVFKDICTTQELRAISQRLVVAKMLNEGKVYSEIVSKTGASTATISRVNRSLSEGKGYPIVFSRVNKSTDV